MEAQNYMQFLDQLHKRETEKHHNIRLISRSRKIQVFEHCKSKFPTKFSKRRHAYPGQELVSSISKEKRSHSEGETVEID